MTKLQTIALESFDLAHHAAQVNCLICTGGNSRTSQRCRLCYAPLALTHQVENSKKSTLRMVALIGPAGCGKTVYLGLLTDLLSRQAGPLQVLARGAFSVALQQQSISQLANLEFPEPTPVDPESWNWMHFQIAGAKRGCISELIIPDMAGQVLTEDIEQRSSDATSHFVDKSSAALLCVDAERLEAGDDSPDFFAMKAISSLRERQNLQNRRRRYPLAIVFTKADCAPHCLDDPRSYAHIHTPGLWRQCHQRLKQFEFFAVSVVGATAQVKCRGGSLTLPLRIEPRGITLPLEWLLQQRS